MGAGTPPCPAGSICSGQSRTFVGKKTAEFLGNTQIIEPGEGIFHSSATKLNSDGTATTDVYIISDGKWQKAATSKDGGKTYSFLKDDKGEDVAGAGFQNELKDPQGEVHKNVDANINKAAEKAGVPEKQQEKLVDGNENRAERAAAEESNGSGDANSPKKEDQSSKIKLDSKERTNYKQQLKYPIDLNETNQDFLKIMMVKYEPRGLDFQDGGLGIAPRGNLDSMQGDPQSGGREILSNIFLPIPGGIQDSNRVSWGDDKVDPQKVALAGLTNAAISGTPIGDTLNQITKGVSKNEEGAKTALSSKFTESITGVDALARTQGAVLNNNIELLFKGAALRQFTFTYSFSPRSKGEGTQVRQIIRTLKQGMSAKKANNFLFVKSPHTFFLGYYKGGTNIEGTAQAPRLHPYLNKFKECALVDLSVQYAPAGNYATFVDGSPTQYKVTMAFSELEPVFDDDYGDDDKTIGF